VSDRTGSLRLLHLVANRWWTGSADPALGLAVSLRDRGHAVAFACIPGDALDAHARAARLPPEPGLSLEPRARPWVWLRDAAALRRLVRARGIELVHTHLTHDHCLAVLALRGLATPVVRTLHHRRAARGGPARRWLFRRTAAVFAASEAIATAARAARLTRGPLAVIPGAVDISRFTPEADPSAVRQELRLGPGPVVGCVARLVPGRGHDVLLEAAARLRSRWPMLRVLLVGRGDGRPALERRVADLGLGDVVVFAGYRGDDLPEVLTALSCFALLGGGSEESGRAVLEAMAAGRPVIAGRFGAMPESVVEGETGWLVAPDPEAVADRLAAVLADPETARHMGQAGRRRVLACHTPDRRAVAVEREYAGILDRRPGGGGTLGGPGGPC
jgi:glycosyltransferase involved in cell wall biosynthesis